nr:hypothetical protein [Amycolatopsis benzoatilytica]
MLAEAVAVGRARSGQHGAHHVLDELAVEFTMGEQRAEDHGCAEQVHEQIEVEPGADLAASLGLEQ